MEKKEKEELLQDVEETVKKGMRDDNLKRFLLTRVIPVLLVLVLVMMIGVMVHRGKSTTEAEKLVLPQNQTTYVVNKHVSADFAEAILGEKEQLKKIEVYQRKISDAVTIKNDGLFKWKVFSKSMVVTYNGTATYTVDLTELDKDSVLYDEETNTVTMYIPHAKREAINVPSDEIKYSDPEKGLLALGDLKLEPQEVSQFETLAVQNMEKKLDENNDDANADLNAEKTIKEIYDPIISGVDDKVNFVVKCR